jgi:hypothetical protein
MNWGWGWGWRLARWGHWTIHIQTVKSWDSFCFTFVAAGFCILIHQLLLFFTEWHKIVVKEWAVEFLRNFSTMTLLFSCNASIFFMCLYASQFLRCVLSSFGQVYFCSVLGKTGHHKSNFFQKVFINPISISP